MLILFSKLPTLIRWKPFMMQCVRVSNLKETLQPLIDSERKKVASLRKEHGSKKVGDATLAMMYGGMRGLKAMIWDISHVDPEEGIRFRGYTVEECRQKLPKAPGGGNEPLPEGMLWLLLTGKIPSQQEVKCLSEDLAERAHVPGFILKYLENLPKEVHPMTQLSTASALMNTNSRFAAAYNKGVKKTEFWESTLEDSLDLIAALPIIAATIYQNTYKCMKEPIQICQNYDWAQNFAEMLGFTDKDFVELLRMYLTVHADHEGGNVSAHATHLVGSALSDPFLSYSAGMNGLAGPLHGLANQEVLIWLKKVVDEIGESPSNDELKKFIENTLKSGQVVPGYGHAILRKTDPRFTCQREFGKKYLCNDPYNKLVSQIFEVAPPILKATGKIQNPWPNVDAHSGVLLRYYGMTEMKYYTVLFGVSRAIGVLSALVWSRALLLPIERPKSMTTDMLIKMFGGKGSKDTSSKIKCK